MSIECNGVKETVDDSIFGETDRMVMKAAYAAHNHFGRLCDEHIYENDVADRLIAEGVGCVATQVPLRVRHKSYRKTYRLDLVVNDCVYEFKATDALVDAHQAQVLHYAALLNQNRIKLINFGAPRVEGQLVGTPFAEIDRWEGIACCCTLPGADSLSLLFTTICHVTNPSLGGCWTHCQLTVGNGSISITGSSRLRPL